LPTEYHIHKTGKFSRIERDIITNSEKHPHFEGREWKLKIPVFKDMIDLKELEYCALLATSFEVPDLMFALLSNDDKGKEKYKKI